MPVAVSAERTMIAKARLSGSKRHNKIPGVKRGISDADCRRYFAWLGGKPLEKGIVPAVYAC